MRILLIADATLLLSALATALPADGEVTAVSCHRSVEISADVVLREEPDVAVIDFEARRPADLAAVHTLANNRPECGILVLIGVRALPALRRVLDSDVAGFLNRDCDIGQLRAAIKRVIAGERFIEPGVALAAAISARTPLTERELDVLRLAAEGLSAIEIARALFLAPGTVRNYLSTTIRKLGARSRLEAVRTAADANWI